MFTGWILRKNSIGDPTLIKAYSNMDSDDADVGSYIYNAITFKSVMIAIPMTYMKEWMLHGTIKYLIEK